MKSPVAETRRLDELAIVIRSKNAGPCLLTLDVILPDAATYARVAAAAKSLRRQIAAAYGLALGEVRWFPFPAALAIKVTLPRDIVAGDVGDRDIYGAQQHAPLLGLKA